MNKFASLAVGLSALVLASTASAGLITYNFEGVKKGQKFSSYTEGDLTVTGDKIDGSKAGFGIDYGWADGGDIDGSLRNDRITFTFGSEVTLTQINFGNWDWNDDFKLWADGHYQGEFDADPFNTSLSGTVFKIGADGFFDNFRIASITVDDGMGMSAVPEPSTLSLLALGALGVGIARRKKS